MRPRRENDARKRNRAGKREGKSWRRTDRVSHEREQSWLHPREIDWRRINPCGWAATGVTVQVASLGRERKGETAQQGKEGKRIDPKIIVQRLSPTAMKGGKKKKRKSCENSKSLARNRQQIDSNIANCCYVPSSSRNRSWFRKGWVEGNARCSENREIFFNASTGWNVSYAQSEVEVAKKGRKEIFLCATFEPLILLLSIL